MLLVAVGCAPTVKEENPGDEYFVREFTYKGHRYLEFKDNYHYGQGFVHDPDCPCHEYDGMMVVRDTVFVKR